MTTAPELKRAMEEYDLHRATALLEAAVRKEPRIHAALGRWRGCAGNEVKYLETARWFRKYAYVARALRLHVAEGQDILDLGSGPGWFSWVARLLGHRPRGVDMPGAPALYRELCAALEVPVTERRMEAHTSLPRMGRFHVAVALMASFHLYHREWDARAFDALLADLESRMHPRHVILFELNHNCGRPLDLESHDCFVRHGFRLADNFCFRAAGWSRGEETFLFNALSRFHRLMAEPFAPVWRYAAPRSVLNNAGVYLDALLADFPGDAALTAHKALWHALRGEREPALPLMERAAGAEPGRAGYAVGLAQLHLLAGDRPGALGAVLRHLRASPQSPAGREWAALLAHDAQGSVAGASPYWAEAHAALSRSALFRRMVEAQPRLAAEADPASWYLRHGVMGSGFVEPFTPAVYWGRHDHVFRAGLDPLVHFPPGETGIPPEEERA